MSSQSDRAFVEEYFKALADTTKPADIVDQYVSDPELKHHIELFEDAFPGYEVVAEDMIAEDGKVAVRATFRGTHRGEFFGIAPTGTTVSISLMLIYRIENDKIVEHWMNADQLSMMQQLGAVPA